MTEENFYFLATIAGLLIMAFGFSSLNFKLKDKLRNEEVIIAKLDQLIKKQENKESSS